MDAFIKQILPGSGRAVCRLQEDIARVNINPKETRTILLLGEPGVGKSHIARLICEHRCWLENRFKKSYERPATPQEMEHQKEMYVRSRGKDILEHSGNPFASVLVPTLEGEMGLSHLFGHKKGAFTGALSEREGFFGNPSHTDVFLDEIGYASKTLQQKLLQICQSGEFHQLGSDEIKHSQARILFATNKDLKHLVESGAFQPDLYWRMLNFVIEIPALRHRRDEIASLCKTLLDLQKETALNDLTHESPYNLTVVDLEWAVNRYNWPGNIRELQQCINRWLLFRNSKSLEQVCEELQPYLPLQKPESFLAFKHSALVSYFEDRLHAAAQGQIAIATLVQEIDAVLKPISRQAIAALLEAIERARKRDGKILPKIFGARSKATNVTITNLRKKLSE